MNWIKRNSIIIIACLLTLNMMKSCQIGMKNRTLQHQQSNHIYVLDSLREDLRTTEHTLVLAQDSIKILNAENQALNKQLQLVNESMQHARSQSSSLANSMNKMLKQQNQR